MRVLANRTQAAPWARQARLKTRVPAPKTREYVRRNEPYHGDREARRRRDAVQQDRQPEDEREHETEHDWAPLTTTRTTSRTALCAESTNEGRERPKSYKTYYTVPAPVPGVDAGRTLFHVR